MLRSVFAKTLRDARRGLFWWAVGTTALVGVTMAFYPSIRDMPQLDELAEQYPELVKLFAGADLEFTSPAGFLNSQLFAFMIPLLFLILAVGAGARAVAGEEEAGTLDLMLAQPVSRARFVLDKAGALTLQLGVLALATYASTAISTVVVEMEIGTGRIAAAVAAVYLVALGHGLLALVVGAASGSRALAIGISAAVAVGAYLLVGLADIVDALEPWRVLSPFHYVGRPLRQGLELGNVAVLSAIAGALVLLSPFLFGRRDIAV